jgi:hypothetical protein
MHAWCLWKEMFVRRENSWWASFLLCDAFMTQKFHWELFAVFLEQSKILKALSIPFLLCPQGQDAMQKKIYEWILLSIHNGCNWNDFSEGHSWDKFYVSQCHFHLSHHHRSPLFTLFIFLGTWLPSRLLNCWQNKRFINEINVRKEGG